MTLVYDRLIDVVKMCLSFFFNDTATTEIYTLSLHDALPISGRRPDRPDLLCRADLRGGSGELRPRPRQARPRRGPYRSEEHTSELQSRQYLVCRLLLEKKKKHYYLLVRLPTPIHL